MGCYRRMTKSAGRFTLTAIAAERVGITVMKPALEEPTALVFAYEDVVSVSKTVSDFARTSRILKVRGGVLQNQLLGAEQIEEADEDNMEEIDEENIMGRRTRGRNIDFAQAAKNLEEDDEDEEDDDDFVDEDADKMEE